MQFPAPAILEGSRFTVVLGFKLFGKLLVTSCSWSRAYVVSYNTCSISLATQFFTRSFWGGLEKSWSCKLVEQLLCQWRGDTF